MKYSLLILQKEIPNLNGTDLGYYRTDWSRELEPLIILCWYNYWSRVLELVTGEQLQRWTTRFREQLQTRTLLMSGTWPRELTTGTNKCLTFRVRSQIETEDEGGPDLSRGVGPSGSEVKLELNKWLVLLGIGLLKYPGGWSFPPILRFCFSRTWPPLIFSNFNQFNFLSV